MLITLSCVSQLLCLILPYQIIIKMEKQITKITQPDGMSDKAFNNMVDRNRMAVEKLEALRASIERGKGK